MSSFVGILFGRRVRIGPGASAEILPAGAIELDASITETHDSSAEITSFPVEEGVDISDHVRSLPDRITINGVITDTPIQLGGAVTESPNRAGEGYEKLRDIKKKGELVDVVTTLRSYENMAIESMPVVRDAGSGNSVNITMTLVEVIIATTEKVPVPEPETDTTNTKGPQNRGEKPTKPAGEKSADRADQSLLSSFIS